MLNSTIFDDSPVSASVTVTTVLDSTAQHDILLVAETSEPNKWWMRTNADENEENGNQQ